MGQVDLLEDEADADLELDQEDDIEESIKASSHTDDDMLPFPLTFKTSADLRWKLQKADILPAVSVIASQRPDGGLQLYRGVRVGRGRRKNGGPGVTLGDIIKQEGRKKDGESGDEDSGSKEGDLVAEDCDGQPHNDEKAVPREDDQLPRPSLTKVSLLNKPPRLGLSKLYRSSTSLHDVTIMEVEDVKVKYQQEVFIIEKEE